jgi:hypothetical protein
MIGPTLSPDHVQGRPCAAHFVRSAEAHPALVPEARGSATAQHSYGGSR